MSIKRLSGAGLTTPKSNKLWDQTTFQSGMFALASVRLTSTASTVVFSGIPATYTHLQLRSTIINTAGATGNYAPMQFNNDTANNYSWHLISTNGSATSVNYNNSTNAIRYDQGLYATGSNTAPQVTICNILDYTSNSKTKATRALDGGDANGAGFSSTISGVWLNTTDAINTITLSSFSGGSASTFGIGSHFALYGIKVA